MVENLGIEEAGYELARRIMPLIAQGKWQEAEDIYVKYWTGVQWANPDDMPAGRRSVNESLRYVLRQPTARVRRNTFNHIYKPRFMRR